MIISNNMVGKITFPPRTIVRVNSAWLKSQKELDLILSKNKCSDVFLDFPSGRTKPPLPKLSLPTLISAAKKHKNVKYFAVSNAENTKILSEIRRKLPDRIELVPKIETIDGVSSIKEITEACRTRTAMLDKEDLYLDANNNIYFEDVVKVYEEAVNKARETCLKLGVKLYELKGVIFG